VKIFLVIAAMAVVAGCRKPDKESRRSDTVVIPPLSIDSIVMPKTCGVSGTPVLSDQGIGELRVDRTVAEIAAVCEIVSDTTQLGTEGMDEHVVIVRIGGDVVTGLVDGKTIRRLQIASPRYRTRDSLGVDTPLAKIAAMRGAKFLPGEDGVYGFTGDHCGLSFRFSIPLRPPANRDWTVAEIAKAHGEATVDRVLVTRCQR
jgi:hypothetical protein